MGDAANDTPVKLLNKLPAVGPCSYFAKRKDVETAVVHGAERKSWSPRKSHLYIRQYGQASPPTCGSGVVLPIATPCFWSIRLVTMRNSSTILPGMIVSVADQRRSVRGKGLGPPLGKIRLVDHGGSVIQTIAMG